MASDLDVVDSKVIDGMENLENISQLNTDSVGGKKRRKRSTKRKSTKRKGTKKRKATKKRKSRK
tara:strand:- start:445 stop:636 length:192 start_codon:yes stop_codon:yes gene_type:complete